MQQQQPPPPPPPQQQQQQQEQQQQPVLKHQKQPKPQKNHLLKKSDPQHIGKGTKKRNGLRKLDTIDGSNTGMWVPNPYGSSSIEMGDADYDMMVHSELRSDAVVPQNIVYEVPPFVTTNDSLRIEDTTNTPISPALSAVQLLNSGLFAPYQRSILTMEQSILLPPHHSHHSHHHQHHHGGGPGNSSSSRPFSPVVLSEDGNSIHRSMQLHPLHSPLFQDRRRSNIEFGESHSPAVPPSLSSQLQSSSSSSSSSSLIFSSSSSSSSSSATTTTIMAPPTFSTKIQKRTSNMSSSALSTLLSTALAAASLPSSSFLTIPTSPERLKRSRNNNYISQETLMCDNNNNSNNNNGNNINNYNDNNNNNNSSNGSRSSNSGRQSAENVAANKSPSRRKKSTVASPSSMDQDIPGSISSVTDSNEGKVNDDELCTYNSSREIAIHPTNNNNSNNNHQDLSNYNEVNDPYENDMDDHDDIGDDDDDDEFISSGSSSTTPSLNVRKTKPLKERKVSMKKKKNDNPAKDSFSTSSSTSGSITTSGSMTQLNHTPNEKPPGKTTKTKKSKNLSSTTSGALKKETKMTSIFRGVSCCGKDRKWQSRIRDSNRVAYLGRFNSEIDAAIAYDAAARERRGIDAPTNFIEMDDTTISKLRSEYEKHGGHVPPEFYHYLSPDVLSSHKKSEVI